MLLLTSSSSNNNKKKISFFVCSMLNSVEKLYGFEIDEHQFSLFMLQEDGPFSLEGSKCFSTIRDQLVLQISISDTAEETAPFLRNWRSLCRQSCIT